MRSLSVVCTFRNASGTLKATVESLKRQTNPGFSCLLIDDCSTDDSASAAWAATGGDIRFRLIDNPTPGRAQALNLGIAQSETDWFAVLDADDVVHPDWVDLMLTLPTHAAVVGGGVRLFDNSDLPRWEAIDRTRPIAAETVTEQLVRRNPIGHSGCVFSKAAVLSVNGYDTSRTSQFDYDLYVRLAQAGYDIEKLGIPIVGHRIHAGQSFESSKYFAYTWRSVKVQTRAIALFHNRPHYYFWPLARLAWALVPRRARIAMRRKWS